MYSDKKYRQNILRCEVFAPFSRHLQQSTYAQASFTCLSVAMTLLVGHQFARRCVTTPINSLGAKGACLYSSLPDSNTQDYG